MVIYSMQSYIVGSKLTVHKEHRSLVHLCVHSMELSFQCQKRTFNITYVTFFSVIVDGDLFLLDKIRKKNLPLVFNMCNMMLT